MAVRFPPQRARADSGIETLHFNAILRMIEGGRKCLNI